MHDSNKQSVIPQSNTDYWIPKLQANLERDELSGKCLAQSVWLVITVWKSGLKKDVS